MLIKGAKLLWVLAPVGWVTILSSYLKEVPCLSASNQESSSLRQQNALVRIVVRSLGPGVLGTLPLALALPDLVLQLVPPSGSDSLVLHLPAVLLLALHSDQDGGLYFVPHGDTFICPQVDSFVRLVCFSRSAGFLPPIPYSQGSGGTSVWLRGS